MASLERADTTEVRHFALEVLWRGPSYFQMKWEGFQNPPSRARFRLMKRKLPPRQGWETYKFRATFKQVSVGGGGGDLVANVAFHMTVEVNFLDGGQEQAITYQTVVLRKHQR